MLQRYPVIPKPMVEIALDPLRGFGQLIIGTMRYDTLIAVPGMIGEIMV